MREDHRGRGRGLRGGSRWRSQSVPGCGSRGCVPWIVLIRLLMPSAGPLVAPEITALTMPQRCSRTMRAALTTGVQAAARRPVEPPVPSGDRPGPALVAPEVRCRFLQLPSLGRAPRAGAQPGERQLLPVRLSPAALQPLVLRPREDFVSLLHERPVLRAPHLVHRVAEVLGHMEPIERDLRQRLPESSPAWPRCTGPTCPWRHSRPRRGGPSPDPS